MNRTRNDLWYRYPDPLDRGPYLTLTLEQREMMGPVCRDVTMIRKVINGHVTASQTVSTKVELKILTVDRVSYAIQPFVPACSKTRTNFDL